MTAVYDPNSKIPDYNYWQQQEEIKKRQQLADALMKSSPGQGRIVPGGEAGGFYAPTSKSAMLTGIGTNLIGALLGRKFNKQDKENKQRSDEEFESQLDALQDPVNVPSQPSTQQIAAGLAQPKQEEWQGETVDPQTGQVSMPEITVNGANTNTRAPTQSEMIKRVLSLADTGEKGRLVAQQYLQAMFSGSGNEYDVSLNRDSNTGELTVVRLNKRTGEVQTVNTGGSGQPGAPRTMADKDARAAAEQAYKQLGPQSTQEDLDRINSTLAGSGVGQAYIVSNLDAARRTGGGAADIKAEKDKSAMTADIRAQSYKTINLIDELLYPKPGQPDISDREGWNGAIAAFFGGDKSTAAENRMKEIISQASIGLMQALKSYGVGTGAFNGEKEAERLEASLARINWQSGEAEIKRQLNSIKAQMQDAIARMDADKASSVAPNNQLNVTSSAEVASQPGAVPKRGASIKASDYGFGGSTGGASGSW